MDKILEIIGKPENEQLEYKAVLPPSRNIGQMISAFANLNGGYIVLGVVESPSGLIINGLSEDFHANSVVHKAIDLITPKPDVDYRYITYKNKRLYVIKVEKSKVKVSIEGKIYVRSGNKIVLENPSIKEFKQKGYVEVKKLSEILDLFKALGSSSKVKFLEHFQSVLNIVDDLEHILYPVLPQTPTTNSEGKILMRILFSSCADNFETYLSELLYEIYLANPSTLKSNQPVTIKEVLDCADMQEFVVYCAKRNLSKLQRGSVKGFIADNDHIKSLNVFTITQQEEIEKILQIRHLYAHRNGIVDEKFLQFYSGQFNLNDEHQLSIQQMLETLLYLANTVDRIDKASIQKYNLASID